MSKTKQDWLAEKREAYYAFNKFGDILEKEGRALTSEEEGLYKAAKDRLDEAQRQIDFIEEIEATKRAMNEPVKNEKGDPIGTVQEENEKYIRAVNNWIRKGSGGITPDERKLLKFAKDEQTGAFGIELRAVGNLTNGTYVQTTDVVQAIESAKKYFGGWFEACYNWNTARGNQVEWPGVDDTTYTGALEAAGTDGFENSDAVTLTRKTFNSYIYSSQGVTVNNSDLEDSDFDLGSALGSVLGERLWRAIATAAMNGTGSSQPQGLSRAAAKGLFTGNCTITFDRVIQFMKTLDYAYANGEKSGFMFHPNMMYDIMGLKSTTGQPLWQPSMALGQPSTFMGKPYWVSSELTTPATVSANSRHMLFGDFSKFVLRFAGPTMLVRLTERYAELFRTGFIAIQRFDSELLSMNTTTYNPVKYLRRLGT